MRLVAVGCGARTTGYLRTAARWPDRFRIVAGADPVPGRLAAVGQLAGPSFRGFSGWQEMLSGERLGDVAVIGTQDAEHLAPALAALELGYDLLLEKPIASNFADVSLLARRASELDRQVVVCHILRYSGLYELIHEIVARGDLGQVVTLAAREGLGAFHQTHSYVRGHWARTEQATPMIVAKSCHDTDLISWIVGSPPVSVASYGGLSYFTAENRPSGAPARCTDGCPLTDCYFDARRYADDEVGWLSLVMDGALAATPQQRLDWVANSPWGRCVFQCDNDAVDHQVVAIDFANGATATLTMTGLDNDGRSLVVNGTQATLRAGDRHKRETGAWITVTDHWGHQTDYGRAAGAEFAGHASGDVGIIDSLPRELSLPADQLRSGLSASVASHLIAFGAEESRLTGRAVDLAEFAAHPTPR